MTDRAAILGLASSALESFRTSRYQGADQAVAFTALEPVDQDRVAQIYALLRSFSTSLASRPTDPQPVVDLLRSGQYDTVARLVSSLGKGALYPAPIAAVFHDLRGGALSALLLELSAPNAAGSLLPTLGGLTRDCLKLMRTLIEPLDPPARARDLEMRPHSLAQLAASLENYAGSSGSGRVRLTLHHDQTAIVAASCTELGAIERIAFNLLENASRHTATTNIEAWLLVVGRHLRVAVENTVGADDVERLGVLSRTPKALYGAFSTSGSGLGLQTVSSLVGSAYGIDDIGTLVREQYVGWKLQGRSFVTWFHWPLAD